VRDFDTACALLNESFADGLRIFERGLNRLVSAASRDAKGAAALPNLIGSSPGGAVAISAFDRAAQEDARRVVWNEAAEIAFAWPTQPLPADGTLVLSYKVDTRPAQAVSIVSGSRLDLESTFALGAGKGWRSARFPLRCLGVPPAGGFALRSDAAFTIELASIGIVRQVSQEDCKGPF